MLKMYARYSNMRIVYVADIHGGFDRVKTFVDRNSGDVYIIAGDLIDIPFYNMSTAINYHELQSIFTARVRMQKENMIIEDFVDELLDTPNTSKEMKKKYKISEIHNSCSPVLQQKYKVLEITGNETEISDICPARQL